MEIKDLEGKEITDVIEQDNFVMFLFADGSSFKIEGDFEYELLD